jgi:energy-coupling factor transporter ATP-binding protein EcfA2
MRFASRDEPFPGLRPFEFEEREFFFGRDAQIDELYGKLLRNRFVAVVGASGSGKSSLVNAGLLGRLSGSASATAWRFSLLRPQGAPLRHLAQAIATASSATDPQRVADKPNAYDIVVSRAAATLQRSSRGLLELLEEGRLPPRGRWLIIVDQFEELFRYPFTGDSGADYDEKALFVKHLLEAAQSPA